MSPAAVLRPTGRRRRWSVPRRVGAVALLLGLVVVLLGLAADPAHAHAAVRSTDPFDTERVEPGELPEQVTIEFNEQVTAAPDAIRVFDEDGSRVDVDGPIDGEGATVVGRALGALADGGYVVTWAVTSADGHPIRGAFVFTVGDGPAVDDAFVATVFGGGDGIVGPTQVAVTAVTYVAVLLAAGAVLTAAVLRRGSPVDDGWVRVATVTAIAASLLVVPLQAAAASGDGLTAALDPVQLLDTFDGAVGIAAASRLVGLVLLLRGAGRLRVAGAVLALASFLVDGHTRTVDPAWLMLTGDVVHLAGGAVWLGGLALLVRRLRTTRLADDPLGGAELVRDWSRVATVAVVAVVVAGWAMSWATVRTTDALTTAYGTTLLVKLGVAVLVIALGAYNHFGVVPAVRRAVVAVPAGGAATGGVDAPDRGRESSNTDGPAHTTVRTEAGWQRLGATVRLEVLLLVVVLAVTGWLQGQRPAAEELGVGGTFLATEQLTDELALDVVVDPNVAGINTIHLYLLDDTGRPVSAADGVTLLLSLPDQDIGPIERSPQVAGPGHWTLTGRELALPGTWEITATVRLDQFTEESVDVRAVVGAP